MKSVVLLVISLTPAWSASVTRTHHYVGNDVSRWTIESSRAQALLSSVPQAHSLIYAGGNSPISTVKIAMDAAGNTYVIGNGLVTGSMYFPYLPLPPAVAPSDVVVSKIDPGGTVVYVSHLGGKGSDMATGIAVGSSGDVYGVGYTTSSDFPLQHAVQSIPGSGTTGFIFKLDAFGDLVWSTYFGGSGLDLLGSRVNAVAVDPVGNAYVTGLSDQSNLMTTAGAFQVSGGVSAQFDDPAASAFVAKFNPVGALVYSTWLGGRTPNCFVGSGCAYYARVDSGLGITVDREGNAYVAGVTNSIDFPTTDGALQTSCNCPSYSTQAFVTKLRPTGASLGYSTYLGGIGYTGQSSQGLLPPLQNASRSLAISVDSGGNAYVALPAVEPFSSSLTPQILVAALHPTGSALAFSVHVGGPTSYPTGIAVDAHGDVLISGTTSSQTFPDSLGAFPTGSSFVTELSPGAAQVLYSLRLPPGAADADVAIDPSTGNIVTAGTSGSLMRLTSLSTQLPPVLGIGNAANWSVDQAVTPMEIVSIYGIGIGPKTPVTAPASSGTSTTSLGGVQVFFNGKPAPLLYVSANQINTVVSDNPGVYFGPETVQVVFEGVKLPEVTLPLTANMPGIFHNPDGTAVALNSDGTVNGRGNKSKNGSVVSIFGTGVTDLVQPVQSGFVEIPGFSQPPLQITYQGPARQQIAGTFEISVAVPSNGPQDPYPLQVLAGGVLSPVVYVWVAP